jgi:hypothetical protein
MKCGEAILDPDSEVSAVGIHKVFLCDKWLSYYDFEDYEVITRPFITFVACESCAASISQ